MHNTAQSFKKKRRATYLLTMITYNYIYIFFNHLTFINIVIGHSQLRIHMFMYFT